MGEIKVGDRVFDESGRPCNVTGVYAVETPSESYRLHFSDGTTIDACADHQWVTWTHAERKAFLRSAYEPDRTRFSAEWPAWRGRRKLGGTDLPRSIVEQALEMAARGLSARKIARAMNVCRQALAKHLKKGRFVERVPVIHDSAIGPRVRTTKEIFETQVFGKRGDVNHCIPQCGPLRLPEADLPVPPYTLGAWLGDGSASGGSIAQHQDDAPFLRAQIEADGFATTNYRDPQQFGTIGLHGKLRAAGILLNKHVPAIYLRASIEQRLALLQGLMDTDGGNDNSNLVSFRNTNKGLADAVHELVVSLGMRAYRDDRITACDGKPGKRSYRVAFTPTMQVFRLPRKAQQVNFDCDQQLRRHHRMIVKVERADPVPMRCISVDSRHRMYLCGREMVPTHNTRTGAEWVDEKAQAGIFGRMALVAETAADARDVIVEGPSGIMKIGNPAMRPKYEPSKRRVTWPNGAMATLYSADDPEQLRGPQHDAFWADELAKWRYPEAWDQLMFGLRIPGKISPRGIVTTTPKPSAIIKDLMQDPNTRLVRGSTFDNAGNLAPTFLAAVLKRYQGTRMGRQELYAEVLDDVPGALWTQAMLDANRVKAAEECSRVVVAIDPSVTAEEDSDLTGIVVAGKGKSGLAYVRQDASGVYTPDGWARKAVALYHIYNADRIVAEVNNGGDMVERVVRTIDPNISFKAVRATRGKAIRAEPVAALYEQNKVKHVGVFADLEEQMRNMQSDGYIGTGSPDRCDALVWALTDLMIEGSHVEWDLW